MCVPGGIWEQKSTLFLTALITYETNWCEVTCPKSISLLNIEKPFFRKTITLLFEETCSKN